ncbi:DUF3604 domain-containing protein [Urechidicola vernalis]|uniref:DUF3604 domain-containing protein n=1 Tax=Urechidicola vernalis TaxID=3075600 RepID=A0ABU2Y5I2_9FLAO|nr:DUF3604 domain-containing protein [Urechidicola sp. P050]MDT0553461.1 DUF3604 domain-containing protein [Urechidicola sp. P050]
MKNLFSFSVLCAILLSFVGCKDTTNKPEKSDTSNSITSNGVAVKQNPLNDVYWGDTHLHTNLSMDAGAFGNRIGMDEAYRFARGEEVMASSGQKAKLSRPLDFLVVADHTDGMGLFSAIQDNVEWLMKTPEGPRWKKLYDAGKTGELALDIIQNFSQDNFSFSTNDPEIMTPLWSKVVDAGEKYNEPGKFTALLGYEWTSLMKGNNLHRVVVYRDNGDKVRDFLPYTAGDSTDPEDLWKYMAKYEAEKGGNVLAIAHNGNLSNGMMFAETTISGEPLSASYAKERILREPLYEITQIKGDGEAHPFLSPNDEFADYENWDKGNLDLSEPKTNEMLQYEYGRSALKLGLKHQRNLGVNPFKFGFIGSTDSHTSLATADENNFFGKASNVEPNAERAEHDFVTSVVPEKFASKDNSIIKAYETVASGYAAVWAKSNTREDIYDAMVKKETYATTGSRIKLRFFGGWDFSDADMNDNYVQAGYDKGVAMGGDLGNASSKAPSFMVHSMMDPESGSLDRIQVVKGWVNADGSMGEKVYDVTWSGDRKVDANGKVPSVGNSVNLENATWDNSIGSAELSTVWTDPDFNAAQESFYYVRVIEIPTPRWTLYDKVKYGAEFSDKAKLTSTERAYSSPIWYTPK